MEGPILIWRSSGEKKKLPEKGRKGANLNVVGRTSARVEAMGWTNTKEENPLEGKNHREERNV